MESIMSVDEKRVELKSKIETDVSETIKKIGVPPHIKGYNYLRESIMMSIYDPSNLQYITKNLYPGIAKRYNSTVTSVERAIRHAIATAWDRNRTDVITEMFGYNNVKPTNSEFIATFADNFRLKYRLNLI
jgi:two-component system response regulator (stage 0 sporulation protein A)